jgi:hypothetical protein
MGEETAANPQQSLLTCLGWAGWRRCLEFHLLEFTQAKHHLSGFVQHKCAHDCGLLVASLYTDRHTCASHTRIACECVWLCLNNKDEM